MTGGLKDAPSLLAGAVPTVGELFRSSAQVHSSSIAIEYQGRHISYGELLERVERASAMLASHGLRRGDRVALLSHNRPEYFEIELAAANLGVITACLNWRLSPRELAYCVELVSPKLVIVEQALTGSLPALALERSPDHRDRPALRAPAAATARRGRSDRGGLRRRPGDSLHQRHHRPAERRGDLASRDGDARAGVHVRTEHFAPRQLCGVGADVSYGFHRSRPGDAAARRHGGDDRRFPGRTAARRRRAPPDRLAGADSRHGGGVCGGAEGAIDDGPGYRRLRRDGRSGAAACASPK